MALTGLAVPPSSAEKPDIYSISSGRVQKYGEWLSFDYLFADKKFIRLSLAGDIRAWISGNEWNIAAHFGYSASRIFG
jgi:hypothetical protein